MSDTAPESAAYAQDRPRQQHVAPAAASPRWLAPAALLLSALATGISVWALAKPAPAPVPVPTPVPAMFAGNPAAAEPKAEACKVASLVADGVALQSRADLGPEPVALDTVAANTRLAMAGGAAYLRDFTPSNTPAELAGPIATLANQLQDIAQHFFVGQSGSEPEQGARMNAATETTKQLVELCK